jgi:predicted MFS family arabinose efflux permease
LLLLAGHARSAKPRLDIPGTLTASAGLFALVYGFSEADKNGWGGTSTLGFLAAGVALLAGFVVIQQRAAHPLLPLRIVLDRNRGGSFLAMLIAVAGMFGVFVFLTYYLQQTLGYSPVESGLAYLPMIGALVATSTIASTVLLPRVGPRLLVLPGMLIAAGGMVVLAQLGVHSTYAAHIVPGLIPLGVGLGLITAPAMNTATLGVDPGDAGVASATVNTAQQVGGSLGTALLNTIATTATASFVAGKAASPAVAADAAVHGYTTAFWWAAAIFAAGAVICGLLLRPGSPRREPAVQLAPA